MIRIARNNLLRIDSFSFDMMVRRSAGLTPSNQAIATLLNLALEKYEINQIQEHLIHTAENAYILRRMGLVELVGRLLIQLPLADKHLGAGQYYLALALKRKGNLSEAEMLFNTVAGIADGKFTARAVNSLGAILFEKGDIKSSIDLRHESVTIAENKLADPLTMIEGRRAIAIVKSLNGNHKEALDDLSGLLPIIQGCVNRWPYLQLDIFNSIAVELCELGMYEPAMKWNELALASAPRIPYSEWLETRAEITRRGYRASRLVVMLRKAAQLPEVPKVADVPELPTLNVEQAANRNLYIFPIEMSQATSQSPNQIIPSGTQSVKPITRLEEWQSRMAKSKANELKESFRPDTQVDIDREATQREIMSRVLDKRRTNKDLVNILEYLDQLEGSTRKEQ